MPENNAFSTPLEHKVTPHLSAREKLFADMGLSPQSKLTDSFVQKDSSFLETDFSVESIDHFSKPKPTDAKTESIHPVEPDEELVVDAIFAATSDSEAQASEQTVLTATGVELTQELLITESAAVGLEPATKAVLNSLDQAGLDPIVAAYLDLQQKIAANQSLISTEREAIADLRNHMRQLNAHGHDLAENSTGLDQSRKLIQADSCENLISSLQQVNALIQADSQHAAKLITPIKVGVEILEVRVKHVSAIENLLAQMQTGLKLQQQLAGADALIHDLAQHLGLNLR